MMNHPHSIKILKTLSISVIKKKDSSVKVHVFFFSLFFTVCRGKGARDCIGDIIKCMATKVSLQ